ncbi:DUF262 domain-containing protein [Micromonospora saelicesensis]|uniref:DUF262 domain-containing protein n=1 Tax=Micromonospora saelicesensis TaxID=285676 RepID=UPI000DC46A68|nr:DUF262 domain-containing protein [Micromonospora saelicesensis]RAO54400.1 hypothetical protein PSN01_03739 [Micromonospora saelicesensis]
MSDEDWTPEVIDIERASYSVAEFIEWFEQGRIILSPDFQRGEVWRNPAKAFLIDTILRGYPVPPIHMRFRLDRGKVMREVIDGQQRLTSVIQFYNGPLALPKGTAAAGSATAPWAGLKYSQLPDELQERFLTYTFRCEVYRGSISDNLVQEIFSRINIHSVPLSDQELRNGRYFGEFKQAAYSLAKDYNEFWKASGLFSIQARARMLAAQFVSEVLIMQMAGMQDKKSSIDSFYARYDSNWDERLEHEKRFRQTMETIRSLAGETIKQSKFRRVPLFYTLYAVVYHRLYGIDNQRIPDNFPALPATPLLPLSRERSEALRNSIEVLSDVLGKNDDDDDPGSDTASDSAADNAQGSGGGDAVIENFIVASSQQTDNIRPRLTRFHSLWKHAGLSER